MEVDTAEEHQPASPQNEHKQCQQIPEQLMNGDEDPYKPEGRLLLKIEKFSEFAREGPDSRRLSDPVYIRGLPWRILAIPRELGRRGQMTPPQKCLGYFLQCNADNHETSWNCAGSAKLKILSQKEGKEDHVRAISHVFHAKENDWGFAQFMTFESLMEQESGWYDEEADTIILSVDVTADAPHGVNWDSKKDTGCIGLKNQGATCYMNSILQTLFFTNKLRKAVYQMPTEEDNPDNSVALAMQRVFYELQFADSPVGTKKLTKSFGWDSIDSFLQHDVQEFCRVLLDNLENKMKNTKVVDTIPSLFKGRMKSYIKCKEVEFESSREECFYDLQLNVKNKSNVLESFKDYIESETLDGENKYDAGDFGLQPAVKGLKFLSFPPVLHLQLMRFQYDPLLDLNVKINDRFEFPDVLNLDEFVDKEGKESAEDEYVYLLHAVLVHSGDFHGGHYVAFINTNLKGTHKWCKFDDDVVSRVAHRDAVTANFGGDNTEGISRSFTNAYMLVYIRQNALEEALCPVSAEDIPDHLKIRFDTEKKRELEKRMEREEASNYCEITLILDEDMKANHEFELFDFRALEAQNRKMKVQKNMTYKELYTFVATNMRIPEDSFRLWDFAEQPDDRQPHRIRIDNARPRHFINPEELSDEDEQKPVTVRTDHIIYLEMGKLAPTGEYTLKQYDTAEDVLVFIKYYNHERNQTEFKGTLIMHIANDIGSHYAEINQLIGQPPETSINLYLEHNPNRIMPVQHPTFKVRDVLILTHDGCILVAEIANKVTEELNTQSYFRMLYNRIEVEAHPNEFMNSNNPALTPAPPIKGQLGLDWKLNQVCEWIGSQIDYDPAKILLFKNAAHSEKPLTHVSYQNMSSFSLLHILGMNESNYDPRNQKVYKLFYTKLPISTQEMESKAHITLLLMMENFQTMDLSVFIDKNAGTVQDILDEARKEFKFSEEGTGELRLAHISSTDYNSRAYQILKPETTYREINTRYNNFAFRVEEVPKDQLQIGPDDVLMPVAHFEKEPSRTFGTPFFIKVSNGEKVQLIRERIREMLDVPEKEFEKYKFCIVKQSRIIREFDTNDDNAVVNTAELTQSTTISPYPVAIPFLGIQHSNKSRNSRGVLESKKAIVIHN